MATGWSTVTKENTNFGRLCHFLIDGGTQVLRDIFDAKHPPPDLKKHLLNPTNHSTLKNLKSKKILRPEQWRKLFPSVGNPTSASFDITLLSLLLRNICSLPTPANGWDKEPAATSTNQEDDIVRIRLFRNNLHGHIPTAALSDADFNTFWSDIESVLVRLGADKEAIDNLKIQSMDPEDEKYHIQCIQEWFDYEETVLKALEETEKRLGQKMDQVLESVRETALPSESTGKLTQQDLEFYSKNLKEAIRKQTDMQLPKGIIDEEAVKTDDIFTNLTIHHGEKRCVQQIKRPRIDHTSRKTITQIEHCSQIFFDETERKKTKRIVVAGEPGIGKTLFSHKLIRDMANNCLTVPDIKFTYLITFRQLNLLDEERLSLRELLNLCPLLNEKTMINDALIEYIIQHPEQLFVVFDGFDEYKHQRKIYGNCECRFPNDANTQMSVPALVSKLIQKKILDESTIMVTSRPGEANDLYQNITFDQYVEITGFSESQIIEYVEKYFKSRPEEAMTEEEKKNAIDKFKGTAHYMTFGRVPLRCFLMCPVIEWEIKNRSQHSGPVTLTEFYHDVIYCLEKHNRERRDEETSKKSASLDVTLKNLSKLAALLHQENRFSFTLEDLFKLELTENELLHIKSSNLLYCCPVVSNKSKYRETHIEYCFAHLTIQEFLVAWHLVSEKKIPAIESSDMLYIFMGGLLGLRKNDNLMMKLLESIGKVQSSSTMIPIYRQRILSLRCLYEYGQDSKLTTEVLTTNLQNRFWTRLGSIELRDLTDTDYCVVEMLIDKVSALTPPDKVHISCSKLTCSSLHAFLPSLAAPTCNITKLTLLACQLDDQCAYCLGQHLSNTKITELELNWNKITDVGVEYLVNQGPSTGKNFTKLSMNINKITDAGLMHIINHCPSLTQLDLPANQITDTGVEYLTNHCPSNLNCLDLSSNQITDAGLKCLADRCPNNLSELRLSGNKITDDGVDYIVNHRPTNLRQLVLQNESYISYECTQRSYHFCKDTYPDFSLYISLKSEDDWDDDDSSDENDFSYDDFIEDDVIDDDFSEDDFIEDDFIEDDISEDDSGDFFMR